MPVLRTNANERNWRKMTFGRSSSDTFEFPKSSWREANDLLAMHRFRPMFCPFDFFFCLANRSRTNWSGVRNVIILSTPGRNNNIPLFQSDSANRKAKYLVDLFREWLCLENDISPSRSVHSCDVSLIENNCSRERPTRHMGESSGISRGRRPIVKTAKRY